MFTKNYNSNLAAPQLKHLAVATAELDRDIDLNEARRLPRAMAKQNGSSFRQYQVSRATGVTHENVGPTAAGMARYGARLYAAYLDLYENRQPTQY